MDDICSRIVLKLSTVLSANGLAYGDEFAGAYYRSKIYDKIRAAFKTLDTQPPVMVNNLLPSKVTLSPPGRKRSSKL